MTVKRLAHWAVLMLLGIANEAFSAEPYFKIAVVDAETGRGVPLVELRTVNDIRYYTDSHGVVAFHEPGLMGQRVFFHVRSHGYEFPQDGFGYRGTALEVTPGGATQLKIKRINLAERLYRVTGGGIYRDSVLLGDPVPLREPVLNGLVFGSDSVVHTPYRGKLYWFWGDTNRPSYPLGNFQVPGATSELPSAGGLDPDVGVDLAYFVDQNGFAKQMARVAGKGPTWVFGLVTVPDQAGRERMYASYVKVEPPLTIYERGLVRFNDEKQEFEHVATFPKDAPIAPGGHTLRHTEAGVDYVSFCTPFPLLRVRATAEDLQEIAHYEAFTCLQEGTRLEAGQLDRSAAGEVRYGWKRNTLAVGPAEQQQLVKTGRLKAEEAWLQLRDRDTGKAVFAHGGTVAWNPFRKRWVLITVESHGTSLLGEVWYAEADTPLGPWVNAVKIVTHERYSFYNPKQHPVFDKDGGRTIFFEGTYTHTFSGNPEQTPRYDYNQVMYKLDLADPRLALPVPVYRLAGAVPERFAALAQAGPHAVRERVSFFAFDRPGEETIPIYGGKTAQGEPCLQLAAAPGDASKPVFHALPVNREAPPAAVVPLYEFANANTGGRAYSTDRDWSRPGFTRAESPLCLVWGDPAR